MRSLAILALVLMVLPLAACSSDCPSWPTVTFQPPVMMDATPKTKAAPRLVQQPAYYAPTYQPAPRAFGCPPAN